MSWKSGELRPFSIASRRKKNSRLQTKEILAPYDRLLAQLIAEVQHGILHDCHEARRRKVYASQVLDKFVTEFNAYNGSGITFRSKVLTPILQRQLLGTTADSYMVSVRRAVARGDDDPTIAQATEFYLHEDPTDPGLIPAYRFNMVFVPEMRWHLAIVSDVVELGSFDSYIKIRCTNQDALITEIKESALYLPRRRLPIFEEAMIKVLEVEKIDTFFRDEIEHAVRIYKLSL